MNSHQRVMNAVNFKPIADRIPVWDNFMQPFTENWRAYMGFDKSMNPADHYNVDVKVLVGDETFFPSKQIIVEETESYIIKHDGWGRTVKVGKGASYFTEHLDSVLDEASNLDSLQFEPATDEKRYSGLKEQATQLKEKGICVFSKIGGIYIRSHFMRGEDKLLADMALDEKFCEDLFDKVAEHLTSMALETLKRLDTWNTGLWVYDDIAGNNAPMFSPTMYEKYFLPRYKKLIATVKTAGCKHVFMHSDGNIGPIIDLALDAGFEGFNPLEPRCGLDLFRLREKYGDKIVFFGGVCNTQILPRGDKNEIKRHITPLVELARSGGVVLGSASISDDVDPEIYDYYMSLVRNS